jgi:hypothetical protein
MLPTSTAMLPSLPFASIDSRLMPSYNSVLINNPSEHEAMFRSSMLRSPLQPAPVSSLHSNHMYRYHPYLSKPGHV